MVDLDGWDFDKLAQDGDIFLMGGLEITPIAPTGRLPGAVAYKMADMLFTGDLISAPRTARAAATCRALTPARPGTTRASFWTCRRKPDPAGRLRRRGPRSTVAEGTVHPAERQDRPAGLSPCAPPPTPSCPTRIWSRPPRVAIRSGKPPPRPSRDRASRSWTFRSSWRRRASGPWTRRRNPGEVPAFSMI
jgi:hypothetical protein